MRPTLETITLTIDGGITAGIRQRDKNLSNPTRLLCLHGWLDNANSFIPMMPYLPSLDLVSIDLPGHGYSDPLQGGYDIHRLSFHVCQIMQALEWPSCHLMGHSLGGCIAPYACVSDPTRFDSLIMIEASGPLSEEPDQLPQRLKRAFADRLAPDRYSSRTFQSKEQAVASRLKAATMHSTSAKLIIDRQLQQRETGYQWRFDKAWRYASYQYQTEEQVLAVLSAISCPTLTIIADNGFLVGRSCSETRLGAIPNRESVTLSGHHHLHMDTPEPVAAAINFFLKTTPALGG